MSKTHFAISSKGDLKEVRRRTYRYWILRHGDYFVNVASGHELRWSEDKDRTYPPRVTHGGPSSHSALEVKYVFDVIENKIVFSSMSLRDLAMMAGRKWPLREKMLAVAAERANGKKSKRELAKLAKELEQL